jgi:hypothetical protein
VSLPHPIGPPNPAYGPFFGAIFAAVLAGFFLWQRRIFLLAGSIERGERPALYWTLVALTGTAALALLAIAAVDVSPPF